MYNFCYGILFIKCTTLCGYLNRNSSCISVCEVHLHMYVQIFALVRYIWSKSRLIILSLPPYMYVWGRGITGINVCIYNYIIYQLSPKHTCTCMCGGIIGINWLDRKYTLYNSWSLTFVSPSVTLWHTMHNISHVPCPVH